MASPQFQKLDADGKSEALGIMYDKIWAPEHQGAGKPVPPREDFINLGKTQEELEPGALARFGVGTAHGVNKSIAGTLNLPLRIIDKGLALIGNVAQDQLGDDSKIAAWANNNRKDIQGTTEAITRKVTSSTQDWLDAYGEAHTRGQQLAGLGGEMLGMTPALMRGGELLKGVPVLGEMAEGNLIQKVLFRATEGAAGAYQVDEPDHAADWAIFSGALPLAGAATKELWGAIHLGGGASAVKSTMKGVISRLQLPAAMRPAPKTAQEAVEAVMVNGVEKSGKPVEEATVQLAKDALEAVANPNKDLVAEHTGAAFDTILQNSPEAAANAAKAEAIAKKFGGKSPKEVVSENAAQEVERATASAKIAGTRPVVDVLPEDLAGAKPRYKLSQLNFSSDVDKALYIVANTATKSARHDDYMAFLRSVFPGEEDADILKVAKVIRKQVGKHASAVGATDGVVDVPKIHGAAKPKTSTSPEGLPKNTKLIYHVTTKKNADTILQSGIRAKETRNGVAQVFVASDENEAASQAGIHIAKEHWNNDEVVSLVIDPSKLPGHKFVNDRDALTVYDKSFMTDKDIPAAAIVRVDKVGRKVDTVGGGYEFFISGRGEAKASVVPKVEVPTEEAPAAKPAKAINPDSPAVRWQKQVDELDAAKAPDEAYRGILSTGARASLKKGETWRSKVLSFIKAEESPSVLASDKPGPKVELKPEAPATVPETQGTISEQIADTANGTKKATVIKKAGKTAKKAVAKAEAIIKENVPEAAPNVTVVGTKSGDAIITSTENSNAAKQAALRDEADGLLQHPATKEQVAEAVKKGETPVVVVARNPVTRAEVSSAVASTSSASETATKLASEHPTAVVEVKPASEASTITYDRLRATEEAASYRRAFADVREAERAYGEMRQQAPELANDPEIIKELSGKQDAAAKAKAALQHLGADDSAVQKLEDDVLNKSGKPVRAVPDPENAAAPEIMPEVKAKKKLATPAATEAQSKIDMANEAAHNKEVQRRLIATFEMEAKAAFGIKGAKILETQLLESLGITSKKQLTPDMIPEMRQMILKASLRGSMFTMARAGEGAVGDSFNEVPEEIADAINAEKYDIAANKVFDHSTQYSNEIIAEINLQHPELVHGLGAGDVQKAIEMLKAKVGEDGFRQWLKDQGYDAIRWGNKYAAPNDIFNVEVLKPDVAKPRNLAQAERMADAAQAVGVPQPVVENAKAAAKKVAAEVASHRNTGDQFLEREKALQKLREEEAEEGAKKLPFQIDGSTLRHDNGSNPLGYYKNGIRTHTVDGTPLGINSIGNTIAKIDNPKALNPVRVQALKDGIVSLEKQIKLSQEEFIKALKESLDFDATEEVRVAARARKDKIFDQKWQYRKQKLAMESELAGAIKNQTPFADIRKDPKTGQVTLWLNDGAMNLQRRATSPFSFFSTLYGQVLTKDEIPELVKRIDFWLKNEPEEMKKSLVNSIIRASNESEGNTVLLMRRSPDSGVQETIKTLREERTHEWQIGLAGKMEGHLDADGWQRMYDSIKPEASKYLKKNGYNFSKPEDEKIHFVLETFAKIASGEYEALGYNDAEAASAIAKYFREVQRVHGENSLSQLKKIHSLSAEIRDGLSRSQQ